MTATDAPEFPVIPARVDRREDHRAWRQRLTMILRAIHARLMQVEPTSTDPAVLAPVIEAAYREFVSADADGDDMFGISHLTELTDFTRDIERAAPQFARRDALIQVERRLIDAGLAYHVPNARNVRATLRTAGVPAPTQVTSGRHRTRVWFDDGIEPEQMQRAVEALRAVFVEHGSGVSPYTEFGHRVSGGTISIYIVRGRKR